MVKHGCGNILCQVCYGPEEFLALSVRHSAKLEADDPVVEGRPEDPDRPPALMTHDVLRMKTIRPT